MHLQQLLHERDVGLAAQRIQTRDDAGGVVAQVLGREPPPAGPPPAAALARAHHQDPVAHRAVGGETKSEIGELPIISRTSPWRRATAIKPGIGIPAA
jgi:hypothetical protein